MIFKKILILCASLTTFITASDVLIEELQVRSLGSVPLYVMHPKN